MELLRKLIRKLDRVWAIGRENYIRFYPNPGFRIVYKNKEIRWNKFYGYRKGRVV